MRVAPICFFILLIPIVFYDYLFVTRLLVQSEGMLLKNLLDMIEWTCETRFHSLCFCY
ncbi:hypothetical protein BSM4216_0025 [Bacillus smithii]|nr:hypothetical protein BSM4216_0025 [Bacillus smithii]